MGTYCLKVTQATVINRKFLACITTHLAGGFLPRKDSGTWALSLGSVTPKGRGFYSVVQVPPRDLWIEFKVG